MRLARSSAVVPRLVWLDRTRSTNDAMTELLAVEGSDLSAFTVVVTDDQTDGRGRMGRIWTAPAGRCLAASVLVDARFPGLRERAIGWLPLLAGLAMAHAVERELRRHRADRALVSLKWPNDVRIDDRKVCGILCERIGDHVVVGAGVNLTLAEDDLPVPTATSLALAGVPEPDADRLLSDYLVVLRESCGDLAAAGGDPAASGLRDAVLARTDTIGARVKVELPDGSVDAGTATGIDSDGRLVVDTGIDTIAVDAADVTHLRY